MFGLGFGVVWLGLAWFGVCWFVFGFVWFEEEEDEESRSAHQESSVLEPMDPKEVSIFRRENNRTKMPDIYSSRHR